MNEKILYALNAVFSWLWTKPNKSNPDFIRNILVIKWDEIGDMVSALHVFDLLKKKFPNSKITVVCKPFVSTLLTNNPNVDVIVTDLAGISTKKIDLWIELRGTFITFLKSIFSFPKHRLDRGSVRFKQRGFQPHEVETNYNIIKPAVEPLMLLNGEIYLTNEENLRVNELIDGFNAEDFAIIHPGGRSNLRRWRSQNFAELIDYLWKNYQLKTVILGTKDERNLLNEINELSRNSSVIWETNDSLVVLFGVLKKAHLFVGNESGPLQFADLANIPTVGLFGPGAERVFYPRNEKSRVIHHILACNPCDQITCIQPDDWCMDRINQIEVQLAIQQLLSDSFVQ